MKVQLDKTYPMPASPAVTWDALQDIAAVAACMPGAKITQRQDDRHYKGTVTVKVGPATLSFRGDIEVQDIDAGTRRLHLIASGTDTTGSSGASLDLTVRVEAAADGASALVGSSEASVSGKAAAFGGRMMDTVADRIFQQFATNFAQRVATRAAAEPPAPAASSPDTPAPSPPVDSATPAAPPLDGLALLWAAFKDWLRGLFAKKPA